MTGPETPVGEPRRSRADRALATLAVVRKRMQQHGLVAALVLFVVGAFFALRSVDFDLGPEAWWILTAVALLGVPPMILLNAAEVQLAGYLAGPYDVSPFHALEIAVTGTAANLLPIPGATLVRIDALSAIGAPAGAAFRANVAIGGIWVTVSAVVSAALLVGLSTAGALAAAVVGAIALIGVAALLRGRWDAWVLWRIVAVETMALILTATRLWAISAALGEPISVRQATVIAGSYALTSAVGIFPGGLGIREALSSGLAIVVGLPGAVGFLASAVDRALGFAVHVPIVLYLAARKRHSSDDVTNQSSP